MTARATAKHPRLGRAATGVPGENILERLDLILMLAIGALLCGGLVLMASASISLAERTNGNPLFYFERQSVAAIIGLAGIAVMLRVPTRVWDRLGLVLLCLSIGMLVAVLVPGLGNTANGATRWLSVGGISVVQVSEPARLLMLMYISSYAVRHRAELRERFMGFAKPMILVGVTCGLLLAQPDFGASVVILVITLAVLFIAGARLRDFLVFSTAVSAALALLALSSPYRVARLTAFLDPWADPYDSGFQLTQSLIAIGSGQWLGVGLGSSVQKLFYLPEAHTDFVFAVIAEEFGLVGSLTVIGLFVILVWRVLGIARESLLAGRLYQANLAFGFAVWQSAQVFINIGVNMGILPTKGLTLPLVSYGRSSVVVTLLGLGLLLRIDLENRQLAKNGKSRHPEERTTKGKKVPGRKAKARTW
jgi:cell division protein FtsW